MDCSIVLSCIYHILFIPSWPLRFYVPLAIVSNGTYLEVTAFHNFGGITISASFLAELSHCCPTIMIKGCLSLCILQDLLLSLFLITVLVDVKWHHMMTLICISLLTKHIGYPCAVSHLHSCFNGMSLQILYLFLIKLFSFAVVHTGKMFLNVSSLNPSFENSVLKTM